MSRPSGSGNEEEFAYSSSGSEGEGPWESEQPTGKSVLNVFKGYHVPGKYKPSMDASIEQFNQQSSVNQDNGQPEESAASQSEVNIQGPSVIASKPDSMQKRHSLAENCLIIREGATMTAETDESDNERSPPPVPQRHSKSQIVRKSIRPTLSDNTIETDAISLTVESDSVDLSDDSETQETLMAGSDEYSSYTYFTRAQGHPPAAGYDANAFQGQYGVQAGQKYGPQPYWQPYPGQQPYIPNAQYQVPRFPQWCPFPYYPYVQPYPHTPDFDKANRPTFGYESAPFKQKDKESFKPEKTHRKTKDASKQRQHITPTEPAVMLEQERKQNQRHVDSKKPQNRNQSRSTESLRQVENDTTKYCIFAKGIDPKAPEEHIITLFEVCMGNTVDYIQDSMVFNLPKTCAVFSVEGKPDMEYMKKNFAKRRNLSFHPELHLLDKTPMIAISCNGGVTVDMLELYFESERNGGGDVEGTPYETDDGICTIVTFSDAEVVERVCAKKDHTLNGQSLQVSPFYKCELGELYDAELHKFSLPKPMAFSLSTAKSQLLKKTCCSKFLKDLEAHFCECEITENTLKLSCCLTTATPNVMQLRMSWLGDVTYLVEHFFENDTDNRILDFSHKIFTNVNDYCTTFSKHPDVVVLWDESKCLIEVFGLRASTSAVFENIEGKVKQWERQLTMITERIHISFLHKKLMEKRGLIRRLKEIPELDVRVGDDFVDLKGQPSDITQAKLEIHESKNKMKVSKYKHGLSFECAELVRSKERVIALIDESLEKKGIEASWKIEGSAFNVVFVKDQEDDFENANMSDMDSDIVSVFSNILENFILYERDDKDVFHSAEWTQFITDLTKEHDDFAAFDIDEKMCRIGLHGWHENVNEMYKSIESFLDKRVLRTLVLKRGTIQIGFIQRFNRVDIDDLQKNLKEYNGFIVFSDDNETVEIHGKRKDREIVRDELEQIFNSVIREEHTIKNMSVKGALQDKKTRGEIETSTRCLIRLPGEHETFQYGAKDDADIGDDQVPGAMAAPARGEIGKLKFQSSSRRMNVRFMGERHMQDVNPKIRQKAYSNTGYDIIENGVRIFGVNMQLFIGDIFEHEADAIVTSVGSNLELHGAVANGLKKRCPRVKQQCQAQLSTFQKDGILITTCQGLEARQAILVKHVERPSDWKAQMKMCFEVANRSEIKTVAFPILGSGAETLFDALDEFMSDGNTDLKISEVHLIVFKTQAERFQPIIDVLCSKAMKATSDLESGSFGQIKKAGRKLWKRTKEFVDVGYMVSEEGATTQPRHSPSSSKRNTSNLALYIYSDSSENIQRCKQRLETHLEALITVYVKQYKEIVCSLTKEEKEELESLSLVVEMKIDVNDGIVVIKGERKLTFEAQSNVREMLMRFERNRCELEQSQELAKKIEWQYEEEDTIETIYKFYGNLQSFKMEMAYRRLERFFSFMDNAIEYEIDFNDMVEYPKHDKADLVRVVRKEIMKGQHVPLPTEWKAMKDSVIIKLVEIKPDEKQFKDIETRFLTEVKHGQYANSPGHKYDKKSMRVVKIERIQNKALYQQYQAKKSFLQEQKPILPPNMPLERELWHGTNEAAMDRIICHGFNRSYAGDNAGPQWFGQGVYFASDASYSARSWMTGAGTRGKMGYVFFVNALTGHLCQGKKGMRVLEPVNKAKDPLVLYDCAVDSVANPMEFVIFSDTQAYPAYILTFSSG